MPSKDCSLPINAKFVSNGEIFFDELPEVEKWLPVISDVILHVNMTPQRAEDRLLIKLTE